MKMRSLFNIGFAAVSATCALAHTQYASATDRAWTAQVVTGSINPKQQAPVPKSSALPIPVDRVSYGRRSSDKKASEASTGKDHR